MNLDAIYRLIEETQIFRVPQSSVTPPGDRITPAPAPQDTCPSCAPLSGLPARAAHGLCCHSQGHSHGHAGNPSDWDVCEELRLRELEEAKARAAQMEKTMRWWSDCTATWREKWSKVRAERNSAREEGRELRIRLETAMKELSVLKKKQSCAPPEEAAGAGGAWDPLRPGFLEVSSAQRDRFQMSSPTWESIRECLAKRECPKEDTGKTEEGLILDPLRLNEKLKLPLDCPDLFKNNGSENCVRKPGRSLQAGNLPLEKEVPEISALPLHLDEFQKILRKEREMRSSLEKEVTRLESAVSLWKQKYEELRGPRSQNRTEFSILHGQHTNEVEEMAGDMKEGPQLQDKDRVICELRAELGRLQEEKTSEWDQKQILETERRGLERENQRLKAQVKEMDELLKKKERLGADSLGPDFQTPQVELQEKKTAPEPFGARGLHLWCLPPGCAGRSCLRFCSPPI
ncbi:coiled-coil domain-containing protein 102B isoform X2 [Saccopteryx leptura]